MRYIRYSKNRLDMGMFSTSLNVYGIRLVRPITIVIAGELRKYKSNTYVYYTGSEWYLYGNYDIIGNSNEVIKYYDWRTLPEKHIELFNTLSSVTTGIRGRILRIRQRGPHRGYFYYVLGLTPTTTTTKRTPHENIGINRTELHTRYKHKVQYIVTYPDNHRVEHVR